jgi:hypothetical protein
MGQRQLGIPSLGGVVTEFAPDGSARIHFRVPPNLHRVPDGVATAAVAAQLFQHIGPEWLACLITSGGHGVIRPSGSGLGIPDEAIQALLTGIAIALNHHAAEGGHWVVGLDLKEHEVFGMWRDADGDSHVVLGFGEPMKIASWTDLDFAALADGALRTMREQHAKVDATPAQQVRLALGEKPAATRH